MKERERRISNNNRFGAKLDKFSLKHGVLLGLLSGVLMLLSYPEFDGFYLAFIALVPVLIAVELGGFWQRNLAVLTFVLTFYGYLIWWIKVFHPLALPGLLIYLSAFYCTGFALYRFFRKKKVGGVYNAFLLAIIFCLLEYLRNLGFGRFPYGILAYSQYTFLPLIQISEFTGYLGISFLLYLSNGLLADYLAHRSKKKKITALQLVYSRFTWFGLLLTALVWYGNIRLEKVLGEEKQATPEESLKASLVQPWFDFNTNWNAVTQNLLYTKLTSLTLKAGLAEPNLIIWPESAINDYYSYRTENNQVSLAKEFQNFFRAFGKTYPKVYFLSGASDFEEKVLTADPLANQAAAEENEAAQSEGVRSAKDAKTGGVANRGKGLQKRYAIYNGVLFLDSKGEVVDKAGKMLLVGFAEYFPFEWLLERFELLRVLLEEAQASNFTPFPTKKLFFLPEQAPGGQRASFATLVCYEDCFANFTRTFVLKGATFLVVITNDAWSYSRRSQLIHYAFAIFRAIENRRVVLRVGNAGVTTAVGPSGVAGEQLPMFEEGVLTVNFKPRSDLTFYSKYGNWLVGVLFLVFIIVIAPLSLLIKTIKLIYRKNLS